MQWLLTPGERKSAWNPRLNVAQICPPRKEPKRNRRVTCVGLSRLKTGRRCATGRMRERVVLPWALTILLSSSVLGGCFSYSSQFTLVPLPGAQAKLAREDVIRASEIVAETASKWGLIPDPRWSEIARNSRQDAEWKENVLAIYAAGSEAATNNRVLLWVLIDKNTGQYSVAVRDLDSLGSTKFTADLESSLTHALSTAFPSRRIQVERATVGPALGP